MLKNYFVKNLLLIALPGLLFAIASCKKDNNKQTPTSVTATPKKLGLYELDGLYQDTITLRDLLMEISNIGTQPVNYYLGFDTGSGGLVIDAEGILPASMITSTGFNFTGDSTVVNGITITNQTTTIEYGEDDSTTDKVYGNLCYAPVTLGDAQNGDIVIKRVPFFMYYKAVDSKGVKFDAHEFDILGVSPEYDFSFNNGAYITSPLTLYNPGTGLKRGFKLAALGASNFSTEGNLVPDVLTLGLTDADLSASSGFVLSTLPYNSNYGYDPFLNTTVTYNGITTNTYILFDTGNNGFNYIENTNASSTLTLLPTGSKVSLTTTSGFTYSYTATADNLTYVENPTTSGAEFSSQDINFFLNNEYLLDYTDHKLGLKNN